jgi:XRE family transcriptional regulator, aerobic/anaerobic benzoate catabolism transcriptional regulator
MPGPKHPVRRSATNSVRAYAEGDLANRNYLSLVGEKIRSLRSERGITRKMLAMSSGVSERFLAELESGSGNASILLLRHLAKALDVPIASIVAEGPESSAELTYMLEFLRHLDRRELSHIQQWLDQHFGRQDLKDRLQRLALVGLRGAGKSTIGAALAKKLNLPFLELDRMIEKASGVPLSAMFDMYGQEGYRRFELTCLDELLVSRTQFVLATGGSIVSEPITYSRLLTSCYTVWLRAEPEDHMKRVIAQGDMRPMAQSSEAMSDLKRILSEREPFYARADLVIDTSQKSASSAVASILAQMKQGTVRRPD